MGGGAEERLGYADDRDRVLVVDVGSEPGAACWILVHVAVDDDEAQCPGGGENGAKGRQFAQEELAGTVRRDLGHAGGPLGEYVSEVGAACDDHGCAGASGSQVADIHGRISVPASRTAVPGRHQAAAVLGSRRMFVAASCPAGLVSHVPHAPASLL